MKTDTKQKTEIQKDIIAKQKQENIALENEKQEEEIQKLGN